MIRRCTIMPVLLAVLLLAASCTGTEKKRDHIKMVGGCVIDTIALDAGGNEGGCERSINRLEILSLDSLGVDFYSHLARELGARIDTLGIAVLGRSGLLHVKSGACWPAYRVIFFLAEDQDIDGNRIRASLLDEPIASILPSAKRGDSYGLFFIGLRRGDKDVWTLFYHEE